jgi:hypothetical protein
MAAPIDSKAKNARLLVGIFFCFRFYQGAASERGKVPKQAGTF